MSGHNKWSSIKHQKGVADAKRGQVFTRLTREIMMAVREGGGSPDANYRLRLAVQKARDSNMPLDNIDRAIKKGLGEGGGDLVEITLEGYGPGGAAVLVHALTDNRNRTVQEIRNIFTRAGGSMSAAGSVSWLFESKGLITIKTDGVNAEDVELQAIDAGAEDVKSDKDYIEIYTKLDQLEAVRKALEAKKFPIESAQMTMTTKTTAALDDKTSMQTLKLLDKLEELDDVEHVHSNADFPDKVLEEYRAGVA